MGRQEIVDIRLRPGVEDGLEQPGVRMELIEILKESDPLERARLLAPKLQSLSPADLPQAVAAYQDVFFEIGDFEFQLLGSWWARFDPENAIVFGRDYWDAAGAPFGRAVIREWASTSPDEAMQYAIINTNADDFFPYINSVITGWDESGQPGLYDAVRQMGSGHQRQRALMQIAERRTRRDGVDSVIEWVESMPRSSMRDAHMHGQALVRVARAVTNVDPQRAAALAEKYVLAPKPYPVHMAAAVSKKWIHQDPEASMAWVSTLPEGAGRDRAAEDGYRMWARKDSDASMAWAAQQPLEAEWFQPALSVYARQKARVDIDEGIELALAVHHPKYRLMTIGKVVREWIFREPELAVAWLEESDLDEADKKRILALQEVQTHLKKLGLVSATPED
ncbi:MAG: hypothetical protein VX252_14695 [Myxococcota bacterium]|nr:hypothetical protein [Myxococcota bacterium]